MRRSRWIADLALLAICAVAFVHIPVSLMDDAFIAYRYAANLVHGFGLVLTPGQHVEGISDLGWTVLMAMPIALNIRPEIFAILLGAAASAIALVLARRMLTDHLQVPLATAFGIVALAAANCDFWIMAGNGIESGLYALVLSGSLLLLLQGRLLGTGLLLGLATTLRPESLALAPMTVVCAALGAVWLRRSWPVLLSELRRYRNFLLAWFAIVLPVLLWRYSYYGAIAPNSLFAKSHIVHLSDLSGGLSYSFRFMVRCLPWVPAACLVLFLNPPFPLLLGLFWFAFQMTVVLPNGGDWMPGYRLLSVFIPIVAVLAAFAFDRLLRTKTHRTLGFTALCATVLAVQIYDNRWTSHRSVFDRGQLEQMVGRDENSFMQIAAALKPALTPQDVLAPEVLGVFSYLLPDSPMHDFLGLADAHIAHHGTIPYPLYGKLEPLYSVETVAPAVFVMVRADDTYHHFERETYGSFARRYGLWMITNRPERIVIALRRDREQALLAALRQSPLQLQPFQPM